jgi:predicted SprT family Zn-dependent metalloprotease
VKYLIIAAVVAFAFVVVYSRLRPYLQLIQKVVNSLNVSANVGASTASPQKRSGENKLVRCAGCQTWIPEDRAMNLNVGLATYCSPECLEKKSETKERKLAG